jgi:hypothetical protein
VLEGLNDAAAEKLPEGDSVMVPEGASDADCIGELLAVREGAGEALARHVDEGEGEMSELTVELTHAVELFEALVDRL